MRLLRACGVLVITLAACTSGLGEVSQESACRIQSLLHSATASTEQGISANEAGNLARAISLGQDATRFGTDLHTAIGDADGLSSELIIDLDSVAINAQQAGIFLATGTPIEDLSVFERGQQAMLDTTQRWTQRLQDAGVTCP